MQRNFRRDVQVFLAVAGEPKNLILARAAELAPPEAGVGARKEMPGNVARMLLKGKSVSKEGEPGENLR